MFKENIYKVISRTGYKWTPRAYTDGLEMSYHLRKLFSLFNISCVIDVGANRGQYRNFLRRRCGYDGLIISFEPVSSLFEIIRSRAESDPKWIVNHRALGAVAGKSEINVMQDDHFNSFLKPHNPEIDHPYIRANNVVARKEQVIVSTLAEELVSAAKHHELGNIYLKMDTQGFDFEVLKGAGDTLSTVCALQTEVSIKPLYEGMVPVSDAISQLAEYGFDVSGMFSVERDQLLRLIEMDCIAVRSPDRNAARKSSS